MTYDVSWVPRYRRITTDPRDDKKKKPRSDKSTEGFNLIEILIVLILTSLLLILSLSPYPHLKEKIQAKIALEQLYHALQLGRSEAIRHHVIVTLCPIANPSLTCLTTPRWEKGYILFQDPSGIGKPIQRSNIIKVYSPPNSDSSITFQSFPLRYYLQFNPEGSTQTQNGTFRYCPKNKDVQAAKALFIIQTGRIRLSQDQDKDGIDEDSEGRPLQCP